MNYTTGESKSTKNLNRLYKNEYRYAEYGRPKALRDDYMELKIMQKGDETVLNMRSCEIRAPSATKISFFSGCCNSMNYSVVTGICWDPLQGKGEPRSPCILEKWGYVHGGKIVVFGPPFRDGHREIRKRLQRLLG